MIDYEYQLKRLLHKVNRITSDHRHGIAVSKDSLEALSMRQIEVERAIASQQPVKADAGTPPHPDCFYSGGCGCLRVNVLALYNRTA